MRITSVSLRHVSLRHVSLRHYAVSHYADYKALGALHVRRGIKMTIKPHEAI